MTALCVITGDNSLNHAQTIDQFLSEIEKRAYRMALIATSNRDDALEIVQDSMMKLVNRYSNKHATDWPPLFHRILQSTIRDWYRRSKVRNSLRQFFFSSDQENSTDYMDTFTTYDSQPDEQLKKEMTVQQLDTALHALPLRQQQAFLLRQWEGLDVKQTAHAMSCSESSVKTHYSRAISALRNQLEDHWP